MEAFRQPGPRLLVCTDVGARGLDFPDVRHVRHELGGAAHGRVPPVRAHGRRVAARVASDDVSERDEPIASEAEASEELTALLRELRALGHRRGATQQPGLARRLLQRLWAAA